MIFKFRDITNKRNKGSRGDQAGKASVEIALKSILGDDFNKISKYKIYSIQMCILFEIILRWKDASSKKRFF